MMYFHALYTGTVPWATSIGSLLSASVVASSVSLAGEADLPRTGTIPFISSTGAVAQSEAVASGTPMAGPGNFLPCGPYHAGEEVA
jgi:hypothetical protein